MNRLNTYELKIFASKSGGQFAPAQGGQFHRHVHNGTIVFLTYSPFTLVKGGTGGAFTLTDNKGVVYKFGSDGNGYGESEINQTLGMGSTAVTWYLNSITTPSGSKIQFKYSRPFTYPNSWIGNWAYRDQIVVKDNDDWNSLNTTDQGGNTLSIFQSYYNINDKVRSISPNPVDITEFNMCYLSEITFDNGKVVFNYPSDIQTDFLLNSCKIYGDQNNLLKTITFSYFTRLPGSTQKLRNNNSNTINEINFLDKASKNIYKYSFEYYSAPTLSSEDKFAKGKDWWGYANLITAPTSNNQIPIDKVSIIHGGYPGGYGYGLPYDINVSGNVNCKNPNFDAKVAGMVKVIHYPTGGTTEFKYESNRILNNQSIAIDGPGIRINTITSTDTLGKKSRKTYTYGNGKAAVIPNGIYDYFTTKVDLLYTRVPSSMVSLNYDFLGSYKTREYNSNPVSEVSGIANYPTYYQTVTETESTEDGKQNGRTTYTYDYTIFTRDNRPVSSKGTLSGSTPDNFSPQTCTFNEWTQPQLTGKKVERYDEVSQTYKTISSTAINYVALNQITIEQMLVYKYLYFGGPVNDYSNILQKTMMEPPFNYQVYTCVPRPLIAAVRKPEWEKTITYDENGNQVSSQTDYFYDNLVHVNPTRITTTGSDKKVITKYLTYQGDYSNTPTSMSDLPIEQVTVKDFNGVSKVIGGSINTYTNYVPTQAYSLKVASPIATSSFKFSNRATGVLPPSGSATTFSSDTKYKLEQTNTYDLKNNPITVSITDNIATAYIWDYNSTLPIAKAINASQSQIAYTSFETSYKGNWTFTGIITTPASTTLLPTGGKYYNLTTSAPLSKAVTNGQKYIVSYWSKSSSAYTISGASGSATAGRVYNGWTYYEHIATASSSTLTITGTGSIDEVRLYPFGAQMSTYTYTPLIGMTSQCDVNNRITYYFYDDFQRLSYVKNQDAAIIQTYCYNYNGQLTNCRTGFINNTLTKTYKKDDCTDTAYSGEEVDAIVSAGSFTSDSSQEEADSLAVAYMTANGQSYANTRGDCLPLMSLILTNYEHVAGFTIQFTSVLDSTKVYILDFPENADSTVTLQKIPQGRYNILISKTGNAQSFVFTVSGPNGDRQVNSDQASWVNVPVNGNSFNKLIIGIQQE